MRGFDRPRKRRSYSGELAGRRQVLEEVLDAARRRLGREEYQEIVGGIRYVGRTRDLRRVHLRNVNRNAIQIARDVLRAVARRGQLSRAQFVEALRQEVRSRILG